MQQLVNDQEARPMAEPHHQWHYRNPRAIATLLLSRARTASAIDCLCRIRNVSSHGMMIETMHPFAQGNAIEVELRDGGWISGQVVWAAENMFGVHFEADLALEKVLPTPSERGKRRRPRAPRFEAHNVVSVSIDGHWKPVTIANISQTGALLHTAAQPIPDRMTLLVPGLGAVTALRRWKDDQAAGVSFVDPIPFTELSQWLGSNRKLLH